MKFYVYRTGSNTANQPMTFEPVHVATVEADSEEQACELAGARVTVYANQYLHAESKGEVDSKETEIDERVRVVDAKTAFDSELEIS